MQFGQLLSHLDATQQMIASSLKDNTSLLTQVCALYWSAASLLSHTHTGCSNSLTGAAIGHSVAQVVAGAWSESPYYFTTVRDL